MEIITENGTSEGKRGQATFWVPATKKGRATLTDANGHQKIEEKDVYGRIIKVEEYTGTSPSFTLYATTTYQYDTLGNLTKVTDINNIQTNMTISTRLKTIQAVMLTQPTQVTMQWESQGQPPSF